MKNLLLAVLLSSAALPAHAGQDRIPAMRAQGAATGFLDEVRRDNLLMNILLRDLPADGQKAFGGCTLTGHRPRVPSTYVRQIVTAQGPAGLVEVAFGADGLAAGAFTLTKETRSNTASGDDHEYDVVHYKRGAYEAVLDYFVASGRMTKVFLRGPAGSITCEEP